ncbi:hypothetical protein B0T20DRAFT_165394 [Sordaria brevicollis]|uniref:Uncharacterized protein n=1 Tax=Sordaria brevicollis TaxID=83679 RepID=A0AAE0PGJ0_SORBR|nr:hypothetical protein B0T20DRAFT_165394 [Sordaria brevicollis]
MLLGGGVYQLPVTRKGDSRGIVNPDRLLDFQNLNFFDAETKRWYSQKTTGSPPLGRMGHCIAGARTWSKAGGLERYSSNYTAAPTPASPNPTTTSTSSLSLPGFVWFRANERSNGVHSHGTCAVMGNRQFIIIGGQNEKDGWLGIWQTQDPLPLGLGTCIFDMTALEWKSNGGYDAEVVERWYRDGGLDKVEWDSSFG